MKHRAILACILVVLMLPCVSSASIGFSNYATIVTNNTAMLSDASAQSEIVGLLPISSIVHVIGQEQSEGAVWYNVDDLNGSVGYIVSANVRMLTVDEAARLGLGDDAPATYAPSGGRMSLQGYSKSHGYQHVTFGNYPTTKRGAVQPISWRVLSASSETALLLSDYILDCRPYIEKAYDDEPDRSCDFRRSDLYSFLNNNFYRTAFSDAERKALCNTSRGRVFVLSLEDFTNTTYGFAPGVDVQDPNREAQATEYAHAMGCYVSKSGGSNYWVGSPNEKWTGNMHYYGSIGRASSFRVNIGIRVAIEVDLNVLGSVGCVITGFSK